MRPKPSRRSDAAAWLLEVFDVVEGRVSVCALDEGVRTLGSSPSCDIVLPGAEAAEPVVVLEVGRWLVTVRPQAAAEVRLNGERLGDRRRVVMFGDVIEVGDLTLRLLRGAEPSAHAEGGSRWRAGAVLTMVCLLGGAGLWFSSSGLSLARSSRPVVGEAALPALREFPEVRWERQPTGATIATGFVPSAADRQRLQDLVRRSDPAATFQVQVVEELTRSAREFIADSSLSVAYAGHGEWVVSGTTDSEATKRRLERLARDMKPLATVTDQVKLERITVEDAVATSGTGSSSSRAAGTAGDRDWVALYSDGGGTRYWLGPDGTRHFVSLLATASAAPEQRVEPAARPAAATRVGADEQRSRDSDRRRILERELEKEDSALSQASVQGVGEVAARHAANVEALKRELARLK